KRQRHPLSPPLPKPATMWRWTAMKKASVGRVMSTPAAMTRPQSTTAAAKRSCTLRVWTVTNGADEDEEASRRPRALLPGRRLFVPRLGALPRVRPRIGHESTTVRHLHLGQRAGVDDVGLTHNAVQVEHVGRGGIYLVRREGSGRVERHRPIGE